MKREISFSREDVKRLLSYWEFIDRCFRQAGAEDEVLCWSNGSVGPRDVASAHKESKPAPISGGGEIH